MLTRACIIFLLVLNPIMVFAGEIYGTIRESGKPVKGAEIEVLCGTDRQPAKTDDFGSYRVFVKDKGVKCRLTVKYQGGASGYDVFSYADPVRYEFEWQRDGSGYKLVRR